MESLARSFWICQTFFIESIVCISVLVMSSMVPVSPRSSLMTPLFSEKYFVESNPLIRLRSLWEMANGLGFGYTGTIKWATWSSDSITTSKEE